MEEVLIREATLDDAEGIARVHVDSWRETYAGIVPTEHLRALSYDKRAEQWRKMLQEEKRPARVFVAEKGGVVKGFASVGRTRIADMPLEGELYAIYLLKEVQGLGLGKKMFEKAQKSLKLDNIKTMYLWVLKDNPTLAFYRHMGGREFACQKINIGGTDLEEIAMAWERNGHE